jgi:FkbM family methyltransferase
MTVQSVQTTRRTAALRVRHALKELYLALPFKQQLFSVVRRFWVPPERLRRYLRFRGVIRVDVDGHTFSLMNDAFDVETDIFWCGAMNGWEGASLRLWARACAGARVVVDVGANTGVYAFIAKVVRPDARVYAFEPIARIHRRLVENNALNAFDVVCRPEAVSNYDGQGTIFDLPIDHLYTVTLNRDMHDGTLPTIETNVGVMRLSTFLQREAVIPDLIKIDVESHEPEVIEGLGEFLERDKPSMLVEVWHDGEHGNLHMGERVERAVTGRGYVYYRVDDVRGPVWEEHIGSPGRGYSNYFICTETVARKLGL